MKKIELTERQVFLLKELVEQEIEFLENTNVEDPKDQDALLECLNNQKEIYKKLGE